MTESLLVLRTVPTPAGAPRFATKRWAWNLTSSDWRKISYDAGASFTAHERPVASLADVAALLEKVRLDPQAFIVRGELLPEARAILEENPKHRFRRAKKVSRTGKLPTLGEVPRRWLMIDVDGWPLRQSDDLADDPESAIEAAIHDLLPECFHDVACWWQLSSSAGFVAGVLKVHLFFWLAEPISNDDLRLYLHVHAPAVDRAPFNAAQPHYIADPIIEGGHDPLPRRTGWVKGLEEAVTLPALDLDALRATVQKRREKVAAGAGLDPTAARTVAGALALLGDGEGREGWHAPLRRATLLYARQTPPQNRDDQAVKGACRAAIQAAADREPGEHSAADLARFGSDAYLDALLDGAFVWVDANKREVPEGVAPHHEAPAHDLTEARGEMHDRIGTFMLDAARWRAAPKGAKPPHLGLAVDVGAGKSREARIAAVDWVVAAKAAEQPHRTLWLGPTTKLNVEAEEAFAAEAERQGVTVAVHRGRERDDPLNPNAQMCLDLDAVKLATSAGEVVETAVCGGKKEGAPACPFRHGENQCGYYRQAAAVGAADIVIATHEAGFHTLPGGIQKGLSLTILDEAFWQDGLKTGRTIAVDVLTDGLGNHPVLAKAGGGRQVPDYDATDALLTARTKLQRALEAAPEGYVRREALDATGLSAAECGAARGHEWNRRIEGLQRPGMSAEARREAAEQAGVNAQVARWAAMWTVMADLLASGNEATGRAELLWRKDREGEQRWSLSLNTISEMMGAIHEAPVLLLDATMPADLVRAYLPRLEVPEPVRVKAPHMEVRQVRGGWGKTTLLPGRMKVTLDENGKPENLPPILANLRDFVAGETCGERSLVITYEDAEAAFAGLPGVETGHFNAVAGIDRWKDVRHLFVIGRPRPRSDQVRVLAAALTGEPVEVAESQRETRGVRLTEGRSGTVEVRAYANPAAELVSTAITDAEIVQGIGRARGINRTEQDPVRVWLFADVVTPLLVDELLDWRDLAPGSVERMACRGIFLASPSDAARAYPDLFGTVEAGKKAFQRWGVEKGEVGDIPLRLVTLRGMSPTSGVWAFTYRPKGAGQRTQRGWARTEFDPEDVWRFLEERLGELAAFTPEDRPEPEPPRPGPPDAPSVPWPSIGRNVPPNASGGLPGLSEVGLSLPPSRSPVLAEDLRPQTGLPPRKPGASAAVRAAPPSAGAATWNPIGGGGGG
ncbi:hypothetical protein [Muricoccus nepalensis]|uniref:hypothetical protein n=1 Tax=Muricoccus nepalensis TaxID=1854500 RepID=UPI00112CA24A|nr:hypothetical protein [Roseomonas nepalensis]